MESGQPLVTCFEFGVRLKEDSSRDFVERNEDLKRICRRIGPGDVRFRLVPEEFELLQKMTSTKKNQQRMLFKKSFKKFYGVGSKDGPYKANAGALTSHSRRRRAGLRSELSAREHAPKPLSQGRPEQLHRDAEAGAVGLRPLLADGAHVPRAVG